MKPQFLELAAVFFLLHAGSSLQAQNTALQQVEGFGSIVFLTIRDEDDFRSS